MQRYKWQGINSSGGSCSGIEQAHSSDELQARLLLRGIALLRYRQLTSKTIFSWRRGVQDQTRADLCASLATLLAGGIDVATALSILLQQTVDARLRDVLHVVSERVAAGSTLSDALAATPELMSPFILAMVRSGEESGALALVLQQLSSHLEQRIALKRRMLQAALIPLITLCGALLLVSGLCIMVVPRFASFFALMGKPLPRLTRSVIALSDFICSWQAIALLVSLPLIMILAKLTLQLPTLRQYKDRLLLFMPLIGSIVALGNVRYFLQTFRLFIISGVPVSDALRQACDVVNLAPMNRACRQAAEAVANGASLVDALQTQASRYIPAYAIAMVGIGEQAGSLAAMLERATTQVDGQLQKKLASAITTLGPVLVVMVGVVVALIMVAVYAPLFSLASIL